MTSGAIDRGDRGQCGPKGTLSLQASLWAQKRGDKGRPPGSDPEASKTILKPQASSPVTSEMRSSTLVTWEWRSFDFFVNEYNNNHT